MRHCQCVLPCLRRLGACGITKCPHRHDCCDRALLYTYFTTAGRTWPLIMSTMQSACIAKRNTAKTRRIHTAPEPASPSETSNADALQDGMNVALCVLCRRTARLYFDSSGVLVVHDFGTRLSLLFRHYVELRKQLGVFRIAQPDAR